MRKKTELLLPKTPAEIANGGVYLQRVRCGRQTCRCARLGEDHHAFYFLVRINGKQRKKYVRKADVGAIKSLVERSRKSRRDFLADRREALLTLRSIRDFVSSVKG